MDDEKRKYRRIKANNLRVQYSILSQIDATPYLCEEALKLRDISQSGVALLTRTEVPVNSMVRVRIEAPSLPHNITILGKAVWCKQVRGVKQYLVGIKFMGHLYPEVVRLFNSIRVRKTSLSY